MRRRARPQSLTAVAPAQRLSLAGQNGEPRRRCSPSAPEWPGPWQTPQFAILNHAAIDSGIPRESATQRLGISCALPTIMRFLPSGPKPEPRAHQNQTDTAGSSKWSVGLGELAKLAFPIHPHMLRHGCGFKLANDGVDIRALFTRSQGQRRRKQLIEVVPHNGVAFARNIFERRAIEDVDQNAT